ncbi:MAG: hypothetical protein LC662_05625 [Rhodothermaceae bacterium]|nr:hypothetical protein [Rhodothermaceae bacterium]
MGILTYLHIVILLPFLFSPVTGATTLPAVLPVHNQTVNRHIIPDTGKIRLPLQIIASGLNDASSLYITPDNELFLVEAGANRILKLDKNGARLDSLGRMGFGDYRFDRPNDVDATNGLKIYVSDYNNHRIQIFDRRFQYLTTVNLADITGYGRAYRPTRIAVNAFGELFVLGEEQESLLKFDRNGRFEFSIDLRSPGIRDMPVSMVVVGDMIFLADPAGGIIHLVSDSGSYERFIGGMAPVYALAAYGGRVWAASGKIVYELDRRGRVIREFEIEGLDTVVSIAAGEDYLFLLDSGSIYRAEIPQPD